MDLFVWFLCFRRLQKAFCKPSQEDELLYLKKERENILQTLGTESIWTVDIVCLLDKLLQSSFHPKGCVNYLFCSTLLEMNTSHGNLEFYQSTFDKDQARIHHRFQTLLQRTETCPVALQTNRLPLQLLIWAVNHPRSVAMVLVDNAILMKGSRGRDSRTNRLEACSSYAGHYILLVGTSSDSHHVGQSCSHYDDDDEESHYCFVAYNPGHHPCMEDATGAMYISPALLERSWRASGTDEDIIFVSQKTPS